MTCIRSGGALAGSRGWSESPSGNPRMMEEEVGAPEVRKKCPRWLQNNLIRPRPAECYRLVTAIFGSCTVSNGSVVMTEVRLPTSLLPIKSVRPPFDVIPPCWHRPKGEGRNKGEPHKGEPSFNAGSTLQSKGGAGRQHIQNYDGDPSQGPWLAEPLCTHDASLPAQPPLSPSSTMISPRSPLPLLPF